MKRDREAAWSCGDGRGRRQGGRENVGITSWGNSTVGTFGNLDKLALCEVGTTSCWALASGSSGDETV